MKNILKIISLAGLALTIVPSTLVFKHVIDLKLHYNLMIVGMVLWFVSAPLWMKSKSLEEKEQ
jgi:high-affinity Fe2+/Pb2+ permease